MKVRAYITHKPSEYYSDCQDRFCINKTNRTLAVSDGMSQSIFPEYWAEILSTQYAETGHCTEEDRKSLCESWMKKVECYLHEQETQGKNPWRLRNNIAARSGAGATICGIKFANAENWVGHVLGDSCIIEISRIDWKAKILSSEEKAFDSHPDYYDCFPEKKGSGEIKQFEGYLDKDKILLLVSDPFSEYFDKHKDNCKDLVEQILCLESHENFCKLVDEWRSKGMHKDDSTMCIIEFDGENELNIQIQDDIQKLIEKENNEIIKSKELPTILENSTPPEEKTCNDNKDNSILHKYHEFVMKNIGDIIQENIANNRRKQSKLSRKQLRYSHSDNVIKALESLKDNIIRFFNQLIQ